MSLRNARFRHWMARLALAAILLMAALPTVGRLLESRAPAMHDTAMAMCTTDGLVMKAHGLLHDDGRMPLGKTMGEDCAYCPLLAAMVPLVLSALLLLPLRAAMRLLPLRAAPMRDARLAHGLGARGPPLAL